jgi:hypothetical protein
MLVGMNECFFFRFIPAKIEGVVPGLPSPLPVPIGVGCCTSSHTFYVYFDLDLSFPGSLIGPSYAQFFHFIENVSPRLIVSCDNVLEPESMAALLNKSQMNK